VTSLISAAPLAYSPAKFAGFMVSTALTLPAAREFRRLADAQSLARSFVGANPESRCTVCACFLDSGFAALRGAPE
jgi:hypothetical protein